MRLRLLSPCQLPPAVHVYGLLAPVRVSGVVLFLKPRRPKRLTVSCVKLCCRDMRGMYALVRTGCEEGVLRLCAARAMWDLCE